MRIVSAAFLYFAAIAHAAPASTSVLELTLREAETRALDLSDQLKSLDSSASAASEQASAQYSGLFPRLTFEAKYQYLTNVPEIAIGGPAGPGSAAFPFGAHNNYSFGPVLNYTLWDTGATRKAYQGLDLLAQSREEERRNGGLETLQTVRAAYVRLQLSKREEALLQDTLDLARAQNRDIEANFRAGAAAKLDRLESQREVLNYELQLEQKRSEVDANAKDLLALTHQTLPQDASVKLDKLEDTLRVVETWAYAPPGEAHPTVRTQELRAESSERSADSQMSTLYPSLQFSASAMLQYPIGPVLEQVNQNSVAVGLSLPLFEANRTRHLAAERRKEADAARYARDQARTDLDRDYRKALDLLSSARAQRKLAADNAQRSHEVARLYYQSYKGGKVNLFDVLGANNRALGSDVSVARIDASILSQLFALQYLSGASSHGR